MTRKSSGIDWSKVPERQQLMIVVMLRKLPLYPAVYPADRVAHSLAVTDRSIRRRVRVINQLCISQDAPPLIHVASDSQGRRTYGRTEIAERAYLELLHIWVEEPERRLRRFREETVWM